MNFYKLYYTLIGLLNFYSRKCKGFYKAILSTFVEEIDKTYFDLNLLKMKFLQNIGLYKDKTTMWKLLCIGISIFYYTNPTTAWTIAANPPADHESILYALRSANFTSFANALDGIIFKNGFLIPSSATIFVPSNSAIDKFMLSYESYQAYESDRMNFCTYHIINNNYFFDVLTSLPIGFQIPTLLPNNTLLITNNNPNFLIDDIKIMANDICTIQTIACYAIDDIFNSTIWGQAKFLAIPPILPPIGNM